MPLQNINLIVFKHRGHIQQINTQHESICTDSIELILHFMFSGLLRQPSGSFPVLRSRNEKQIHYERRYYRNIHT